MIEKKFGVMPSPFDDSVVDLYKKVEDAVLHNKTITLDGSEVFVIRDALHLAMPMPLLVCNCADEDENEESIPASRPGSGGRPAHRLRRHAGSRRAG